MREFRAYLATTLTLEVLLTLAGVVYADQLGIPAATAAPIIAAFLLQAALFLLPGFPDARQAVERRFTTRRLAALLALSGLVPYLIYSLPLGLFDVANFAKLALLAGFAPAVFALAPPRRDALTWQDVVVTAVLVSPLISGFTTMFREIFPSPGEPVPRLDYLGKLMVISVGAASFLSLRKVRRADYRFQVTQQDLRTGLRYFLYYLPVGIPFSLAIGLVEWAPRESLDWKLAAEFLGVALGIFLATALPEELCFRGVLQDLIEKRVANRWVALAAASAAFGAVHLSFRFYPNWRHALGAAVLGVFCGLAYRRRCSVTAAAVTHTLTVLTWRFLFR